MPTSKRKSLTDNMNTPIKSHPIDTMVPNAPKKPFAPLTLYRSDSYDVKDFLAAVSNYHPADAIITSDNDDLEDTATSSRPSIVRKVIKSIHNFFCA